MNEFGYYYPAGAENDPAAPWNEVDIPEVLVDCDTSMLLRKTLTVSTTEYETDEDGCRHLFAGYSDLEKCVQQQCFTIPQMLSKLATYIENDLQESELSFSEREQLKQMLEECQGWTQTDLSVDDFDMRR